MPDFRKWLNGIGKKDETMKDDRAKKLIVEGKKKKVLAILVL